jgi:hypothetical protein
MEKVILVEDAVLRDTFWNAAIDLKKENDELKQRIKRLEEAGDEAIYPLEYAARVRIWTEAKEAKL